MSMDLAKKTYSTTPDYFIAGTTVGIVTAAKEADGAVAAHNLVLLDGGKVKPLAAVDGTPRAECDRPVRHCRRGRPPAARTRWFT